jgi:hypothetical protein
MSIMGVALMTPLPMYILLLVKKIFSSVKENNPNYEHIDNEKQLETDKDSLMRV